MVTAILIYICVVILVFGLIITWKIQEPDKFSYNAVACVILSFFIPLLTLSFAYKKDTEINWGDVGPVGDWLAGSTVPFLTLAAFLVAYTTFNNQLNELRKAENFGKMIRLKMRNYEKFSNGFILISHGFKQSGTSRETKTKRKQELL